MNDQHITITTKETFGPEQESKVIDFLKIDELTTVIFSTTLQNKPNPTNVQNIL